MSHAQIEGLPAGEWERFFREAGIRAEQLDRCKSTQSKSVQIGKVLAPLVGSQARIEVKGRPGTAVLRAQDGRGRQKRYYIEVRWDADPPPSDAGGGPRPDALAGLVLESDDAFGDAHLPDHTADPPAAETEQRQDADAREDAEPERGNEEVW